MKDDVNKALQKKAEEVSAAAEFIMAKTRDWQTIKQYLSNRIHDIQLTQEQEKKLQRYQYIYNQMVSGRYTDQEVVNQVKVNYSVELTQAYEDINNTRELFNSVINVHKQFEIKLQLQINRKMLHKAAELQDMKAYAALEKNRAMLIKLLPDEPENPAEFFEGHTYEIVVNPILIGAPKVDKQEVLNAINAKRAKKITMAIFEDIPHEDVKDGL